jgi:uncharacterized membrane protein YoaK (UPF0700 family)
MANVAHQRAVGASRAAPTRERTSQRAIARRRDLLLVALTVSSGAVDAISYVALGKVFTAFMTGNLVFLGIGAANAGGADLFPVCVSLAAFSVGVLVARPIVGDTRSGEDWPATVSMVLGLAAISQLAFLVAWIAVDGRPSGGEIDALLGMSAFAMGLQSGAVRALGVQGVFTTAATATVIVLMTDVAARSAATERTRLEGVIGGLIVGALAGGLLLTQARTYAPVLPLAATIAVIAIASIGRAPRLR